MPGSSEANSLKKIVTKEGPPVNIKIEGVSIECDEVANFDPEDLKNLLAAVKPPGDGEQRQSIDLHDIMGGKLSLIFKHK